MAKLNWEKINYDNRSAKQGSEFIETDVFAPTDSGEKSSCKWCGKGFAYKKMDEHRAVCHPVRESKVEIIKRPHTSVETPPSPVKPVIKRVSEQSRTKSKQAKHPKRSQSKELEPNKVRAGMPRPWKPSPPVEHLSVSIGELAEFKKVG
jgi:hypothetical protein